MFSPCPPPSPSCPPLARGIVSGLIMAMTIGSWLPTVAWAQGESQVEQINRATALVEQCQQAYQQQRFGEALRFCQQALRIYRQPSLQQGFPQHTAYGEGTTLQNLGEIYRRQGDVSRAFQYFQESLEVSQRVGDRYGEAVALWSLGLVYASQEQFSPALESLQLAVALLGDRRALGEQAEVVRWVQHTLASFRAVGPSLEYQHHCQVIANTIQRPIDSLCPP